MSTEPNFLGRVRDLLALTKPRISLLVVITMVSGMLLAPGRLSRLEIARALLGTVLIVAAANTLNMWWERDSDGKMSRTALRPLPAGRMRPQVAIVFGALLAIAAQPLLFMTNTLTGLLGLGAFVTYVFVYTPMKRTSSYAILVGAVPGALPPLMGWTAVTGRADAGGLALFALLFLWQVPHFAAITLFRGEEYARAGLRVLVIERGEKAAMRSILTYSVLSLGASVLPFVLGLCGALYLAVAVLTGLCYLAMATLASRDARAHAGAGAQWGKRLFGSSIVHLVLLLAVALIDRTG